MADYHNLSKELQERIAEDRNRHVDNPYACKDSNIVRRENQHDIANIWRPAFVRDTEKIMHVPYYNRYSDKTQVFSLYKNDDISRRALHVQIVSRIARNIGNVLNLNQDLIEAISLGHDIGHTPFGHAGERILSALLQEHTERYFNHNVHSVRVLDQMVHRNISMQTLDGILCHNGELEQKEYWPSKLDSFAQFDKKTEECYLDQKVIGHLVPSTLEACVMRISDIIAYLGKDRQDAARIGMLEPQMVFEDSEIGTTNAEIINNLIVNIIENSYGKPYLQMDVAYFNALKKAKKENYAYIYGSKKIEKVFKENLEPMFVQVYAKLLADAKEKNKNSILYTQHFDIVRSNNQYNRTFHMEEYMDTEPNQIVVDYIASMTDDYFVDVYHELFPKGKYNVTYVGYFDT